MSETSQGPGWWQASDGLWYPPEQGTDAPPPTTIPDYRPPGTEEPEKKLGPEGLPAFADIVPESTRTAPTTAATGLSTVRIDLEHTVELYDAGDPEGFPVVFHHGIPFAACAWPAAHEMAERHGFRFLCWSRPGNGISTRKLGRTVADSQVETVAVLTKLGLTRFAALGWSGGGPWALANAAQFRDRCAGVALVSTAVPYEAEDFEWLTGVSRNRVDEVVMARHGGGILERFLEEKAAAYVYGSPSSAATLLGGPLGPADDTVLAGPEGEPLLHAIRSSIGGGTGGWFDDDCALLSSWGIDLAAVGAPVAVWQGSADRLVPRAHGDWWAEVLPHAVLCPVEGEGHVSVLARHLDAVLAHLKQLVAP